jgi:hypothetical protein
MENYKEDSEFIRLIQEIIETDEKLDQAVLPVEKKELLEKRSKELHSQYMTIMIQLDRIRIRETPYVKPIADLLRNKLGYGPVKIEDFWADYHEDILDFHEDNELIDRGAFARNYFKLIPPYVKAGTKIPEGIKNIYHESRWCFVYGQNSAAVALCRTVIETVLRDKFGIEGDLNAAIETAKNRGRISSNIAWNANKVRTLANRILHRANQAKELEAKNAIDHVLEFLEEIYF